MRHSCVLPRTYSTITLSPVRYPYERTICTFIHSEHLATRIIRAMRRPAWLAESESREPRKSAAERPPARLALFERRPFEFFCFFVAVVAEFMSHVVPTSSSAKHFSTRTRYWIAISLIKSQKILRAFLSETGCCPSHIE